MDDFRQMRFRAPPGMVGAAYADIGVPAVAMGGGDILPALEKGTIDAAEWCCPKPDGVFGFQKVLKHYYLQGLHQVTVNADMYVNRDFYDSLNEQEQMALEVAANASLSKSLSYRIYENDGAKDLTENHGVILEDTPADYFTEYMAAAKKALQAAADEDEFFAEVWQSQKDFADIAVPFWAGADVECGLGRAMRRRSSNPLMLCGAHVAPRPFCKGRWYCALFKNEGPQGTEPTRGTGVWPQMR